MIYLIQTLGVLLVVSLGVGLGTIFGRQKSKLLWICVYTFALLMVSLGLLPIRFGSKFDFFPFAFILYRRNVFVWMSFAVGLLISVLLPNVKRKLLKYLLVIFMLLYILPYTLGPFLGPMLVRDRLLSLETNMHEGVCLQGTNYNCGPAAAVTALAALGIEAQEGQMAVDCFTTPLFGTSDDLILDAILKKYSKDNINGVVRYFDSVDQLKGNCPVIVTIKYKYWADHYLVVFEVGNGYVIVGDPLQGRAQMSTERFESIWRYKGIVLWREPIVI